MLVLAGRFSPSPWTWGFNHLHHLPATVFWVLAALAGIFFFLANHSSMQAIFNESLPQILFGSWKKSVIISAGLGALFFLFKQSVFFMGDGYLITEQIASGNALRPFDNLDYLGHFHFFRFFGEGLGLSPVQLYQVSSILAGTICCGVSLTLINKLDWEPWRKTAAFLLLFTSGSVALFFGYVESYSLLSMFLLLFVLLGLLVLDGKEPVWKAGLCFALALGCHLSAILFFPGYIFLVVSKRPKGLLPTLALMVTPLVLPLIPSAVIFAISGVSFSQIITALKGTGHSHGIFHPLTGSGGLFHWMHFANLANLAMITAPASIALLIFNIRNLKDEAGNIRTQFLGIIVITVAVFGFLVDRKLGAARDWDLLAAHNSALIILAVFLVRKNNLTPHSLLVPRQIILGIFVSIIAVLPWLLLQNNETASTRRFIDTASIYPRHAQAYAYETLGTYYRKNDQLAEATRYYESSVKANPKNARLQMVLGTAYTRQAAKMTPERNRLLSQAEKHFRAAWTTSPTLSEAGYNLGRNLLQQNKYDEALKPLAKVSRQIPKRADVWSALGWAQFNLGQYEDAANSGRKALDIDPNADAGAYYERAVAKNSNRP